MLRRAARALLYAGVAFAQAPVFKVDANLQSIAVRVTDRRGRDISGLSQGDFTVLEDGKPQKIAFFGADHQPISLAVLLDSSTSMESSSKLAGARVLLPPLLRGNLPQDEIFLSPFTDRVGHFHSLSPEQRAHPPTIRVSQLGGGTALYDALASALCHMRTAANLRQAVVVITDGSDQNSRLNIDQLITLAQSSRSQIFTIGFFDRREYDIYRRGGRTVTLITGHEIDNPLEVFSRLAKETGAESFFPSSEKELQEALARILGLLEAQYTLAYYPQDVSKVRQLQVKVNRPGTVVITRHLVPAEGSSDAVHFVATSCEVSAREHPYPWEPHTSETADHRLIYEDDFSNSSSGWPGRTDSRYGDHEYIIAKPPKVQKFGEVMMGQALMGEGVLAAYGPWWENFRASIEVAGTGTAARGLIFRLNDQGCYAVLISGMGTSAHYRLVKRTFGNDSEVQILPWTEVPSAALQSAKTARLGVECVRDQIAIQFNGVQIAVIKDRSYTQGYVGMTQHGYGITAFRRLRIESLP